MICTPIAFEAVIEPIPKNLLETLKQLAKKDRQTALTRENTYKKRRKDFAHDVQLFE